MRRADLGPELLPIYDFIVANRNAYIENNKRVQKKMLEWLALGIRTDKEHVITELPDVYEPN